MAILVTSPEFKKAEYIPQKFTGEGDDISPPIEWGHIPEQAKSLAMVMDDPDAPSGNFTHWLIYNIPPGSNGLPEGVSPEDRLPDGSMQGRNSAGSSGYYGPYPPLGSRHRYNFSLYALDEKLDLKPGMSREQLLKAMDGHIIDQGRLTGIYARTPRTPFG